jgi:hypothetical protein
MHDNPNASFDAMYQTLMLQHQRQLQQQEEQLRQQQQQQRQQQQPWGSLLQQQQLQQQQQQQQQQPDQGDGSFTSPASRAQHEESGLVSATSLGGAQPRDFFEPASRGGGISISNNNNNNNNNNLLLAYDQESSFPLCVAQGPAGMDDSLRMPFDPIPFPNQLQPAENSTAPYQQDLEGSRDLPPPPYQQHLEGATTGHPSIPPYVMMMTSGAFTEESSRRILQAAASASSEQQQQQHRTLPGAPQTSLVPGDEDFRGTVHSAQAGYRYLNSSLQPANDAPPAPSGHHNHHHHHHHSHRRAALPSSPTSNSSKSAAAAAATEKERFVLFVKILLKCLDRPGVNGGSDDARALKQVAKATILECTRRNRMGDSSYTPLLDALERRLRSTVGDENWHRAARLCDRYLERRRSSPQISVAAV